MREFEVSKAREVGCSMRRLAVLEDPQSKLLLLRSCLGVCKIAHLLQCTPPSFVDLGVALLDEELHVSLRRIVVADGGG